MQQLLGAASKQFLDAYQTACRDVYDWREGRKILRLAALLLFLIFIIDEIC